MGISKDWRCVGHCEIRHNEVDYEEGRKEDQLLTLFNLVSDGIISMEEAEIRLGMTAQEFQEAIQSLKLKSVK